jgi:hypothetical protein
MLRITLFLRIVRYYSVFLPRPSIISLRLPEYNIFLLQQCSPQEHLVSKNVAENVATDICAALNQSLVGTKMSTLRGVVCCAQRHVVSNGRSFALAPLRVPLFAHHTASILVNVCTVSLAR